MLVGTTNALHAEYSYGAIVPVAPKGKIREMPSTPLVRMLDASLNRAGEGLRVVEDFVRFVLDDPQLTGQAKSLRHDLARAAAAIPSSDRLSARDTWGDVGTGISTPSELVRKSEWDVCAASFKRAAQSLRSLEEYGKLVSGDLGAQFQDLRYRLYTLEKLVGIAVESQQRLHGLLLMVLVDGGNSLPEFEQATRPLVAAGVGAIQLREKTLEDRLLLGRAQKLRQLTRNTGVLFIVNDRCDIAKLADADGVHLGQEDLGVKAARAIVGTKMLVGVSTHHRDQAHRAVMEGANYLGAGPTFPSRTKRFDSLAGLEYLREVASETRLPVFAIGGINDDNLPKVLSTGISRVAIGAAITQADQPALAAAGLLRMLSRETSADAG